MGKCKGRFSVEVFFTVIVTLFVIISHIIHIILAVGRIA